MSSFGTENRRKGLGATQCQIGYTLNDTRYGLTEPLFSLGFMGLMAGRPYLTQVRSGLGSKP